MGERKAVPIDEWKINTLCVLAENGYTFEINTSIHASKSQTCCPNFPRHQSRTCSKSPPLTLPTTPPSSPNQSQSPHPHPHPHPHELYTTLLSSIPTRPRLRLRSPPPPPPFFRYHAKVFSSFFGASINSSRSPARRRRVCSKRISVSWRVISRRRMR